MTVDKWKEKAKNYQNITIYKQPSMTLGSCLNYGIEMAKHPVIAKFDDDDYYGTKYLTQALHALFSTEASVVGKGAHTTYFEGTKLLAVFRPYKQNKYTKRVGGGTLVFNKSLFPAIKFPNRNVGEDTLFQKRCLRQGHKIYSTDRHHYVYIRQANNNEHTWKAKDEEILRKCEIITHTDDYKQFVEGEN